MDQPPVAMQEWEEILLVEQSNIAGADFNISDQLLELTQI